MKYFQNKVSFVFYSCPLSLSLVRSLFLCIVHKGFCFHEKPCGRPLLPGGVQTDAKEGGSLVKSDDPVLLSLLRGPQQEHRLALLAFVKWCDDTFYGVEWIQN